MTKEKTMNEDLLDWARDSWWVQHYVMGNHKFGDIQDLLEFQKSYANTLLCQPCRIHYRRMLEEDPPNLNNTFPWSIAKHNKVNERLGKPLFSVSEGSKQYLLQEQISQDQMVPDPLWRYLIRIQGKTFDDQESYSEGSSWLLNNLSLWLPPVDASNLNCLIEEVLLREGKNPDHKEKITPKELLEAQNLDRISHGMGRGNLIQDRTLTRYAQGGCGVPGKNPGKVGTENEKNNQGINAWIIGSVLIIAAVALIGTLTGWAVAQGIKKKDQGIQDPLTDQSNQGDLLDKLDSLNLA